MNTKRFLITLMVAALPWMAAAQAPDAQKADQAQERFQKLKDRLQLTPEQTEQIRPILTQEVEQLRAVRDKYRGEQSRRGRLRMAREMKGVQEATDKKLKPILSKKQMDELKKIREEARAELRDRMGK